MRAEPSKAGLRWPLKGLETDGWPRSHQGDFPYLGKRERLLLSGMSGLYSSHLPAPSLTVAQIRRNSGAWESEGSCAACRGAGALWENPSLPHSLQPFPFRRPWGGVWIPSCGCHGSSQNTAQRDCTEHTSVWPSLISGNVCFLINIKVDVYDWRTSTTACCGCSSCLFLPFSGVGGISSRNDCFPESLNQACSF